MPFQMVKLYNCDGADVKHRGFWLSPFTDGGSYSVFPHWPYTIFSERSPSLIHVNICQLIFMIFIKYQGYMRLLKSVNCYLDLLGLINVFANHSVKIGFINKIVLGLSLGYKWHKLRRQSFNFLKDHNLMIFYPYFLHHN